MANALGIITYNDSSVHVEGIRTYRPLAAYDFFGRYRLVDFPISNMTNSGMDEIQLYINGNPKPLIDHIGRGRQYNINSKHGNIWMIPVYKENGHMAQTPDCEMFESNLHATESARQEYVIVTAPNFVNTANYDKLLEQHIESGADVSIVYQNVDDAKENYIGMDVLQLNRQKGVLAIDKNKGVYKNRALSLQTYIMKKDLFIDAVKQARKISSLYWFRDILNDMCKDYDIRGIAYRGTFFCINNLHSYFDAQMAVLNLSVLKEFGNVNWPIYTKTNDSAPAIYLNGGSATDSYVSNGSRIEGEVSHSIIGRGAVIGKDAVVKNCIIMPGATIGANANLENVIVDKFSQVIHKKDLAGTAEQPLYIARRETV